MKLNELIKVPEAIHIDPGNREGIGEIIDSFFCQVRNTLINELKIPEKFQTGPLCHFERRVKMLVEPTGLQEGRLSDDYAHMLLYLQRVVAVVTETRSSSNFVNFNFFPNLEGVDIVEYSQNGENYKLKCSPRSI